MSTRKHYWPISNSHPEDAILTIVIDSDQNLFTAGNIIKGYVYICFTDTKEVLSFKALQLSLRRNIPELKDDKKHVNTQIIQAETLLHSEHTIFSDCINELNNSKPSKIPFELVLPNSLESSFNSSQITICYELKADLQELVLCGELCDISVVLPIEVIEISTEKDGQEEPTAQIQEALGEQLVTFYASLKKQTYSFGESLVMDFYLDAPVCPNILMNFQIHQVFCLKGGKPRTKTLETFDGSFQPAKETGILLSKYAFLLDNTIFTTQPSVTRSSFFQVRYHVSLTASFKGGKKLELIMPFLIERNEGMHKRYPKIYSDEGYPLLPLTVTVLELNSDGLQSYIPLKQCYENNRLTVKKGNVGGIKAILTILSESTAYTRNDTIKGFVYLSFPNIPDQIVFDKLLIVLVGACQYRHTGTIHKNGEMFLFESKVLQGSKGSQHSETMLSHPSAGIVAEFEFDLSQIKTTLLPTFSSDDVLISYELKADVFNLSLNNQKASLYARLPIVIKDNNLVERITIPKSIGQLCKKDFSISLNMDKTVYKYRDEICLKINLENKSKRQITVRICLVQFTECMQTNKILHERLVSQPILLLVLPKSKLVSDEKIPLGDEIFHFQPTLLCCKRMSVTYSLIVDVPEGENNNTKNKKKLAIPVAITRKQGYEVKELSCEGYPLLPLTLEYYCKNPGDIPNFLASYEEKSLVKVMNSASCVERWKGWKLKSN